MSKKPIQFVHAALLTVSLCAHTTQVYANMDTDLILGSGNTLQNQTYLDNYTTDYGNTPLTSVKIDSSMVMSNAFNAKRLLDFKANFYQRINTYNIGLGLTQRMQSGPGFYQGLHAAVDFTNYDGMEFMQAVVGAEASYYGYEADLNVYVPLGDEQTYDSGFNTTLIGMTGVDIRLGKQFDALELNLEGSYFSESSVKNNLSTITASGRYNFQKSLIVGAKYQYISGLDSENTGYSGFIAIPLFRDMNAQRQSDALSSAPTRRMLGTVLQGQSITCPAGESYSYHGNTMCSTNNPFSSAYIRQAASTKNKAMLTADNQAEINKQDQDLVFDANSFHFIDSIVTANSITVKSGAVLVFTERGFIVANAEGSTIGETGNVLKATLIKSDMFGQSLMASNTNMRMAGIKRIQKRFGVSKTAQESAISATNPGHFIALTGASFMDFNTAIASGAFETSSTLPALQGVAASASASAGSRTSTLTTAEGSLKNYTMGGDKGGAGADMTKYAKVNNVNFGYGGIMLLGANASINDTNFVGGNHSHIYQVGGLVESTTTAHTAGSELESFVIGRGGAQYTGIGNLYDQRLAEKTGFSGVVSKDSHKTIGIDQATNSNDKLPTIAIMHSFFNMGTAQAAAKKTALSIAAQNTTTEFGGMGLVLLGNVVNMPSVTGALADGQTTSLFADIPSNSAVNTFGTVPNAVVAGDIFVVGLNLVGGASSTNTLMAYGSGFGKITAPGVSGSPDAYAQGGANFAFGLDGCANSLCSAYVSSDIINDTDPATIKAPAAVPTNITDMTAALVPFIKAINGGITLTSATTEDFYTHASTVPTTMANRQQINNDAYASRLGTNATILSADAGAASTEIYRIAASKQAFLNANTLTFDEMTLQVFVQSRTNSSLKTETLNKLATKAAAS